MSLVHYRITPHDGGWAYTFDGVFSESFPTREAALKAARRVAHEQSVPGEGRTIEFQAVDGTWHTETVRGTDRPVTDVIE
ncbi:DUF2188 domain-containing protein [Acidocella sp.]|uniref:DUF2188 domain-containing protein n=1 Tax=Acidocella sp. TaxID=50710 RepID=UPI002613FE8C|nr:DUF2188 domain-containing protein [Acidocella sp.]